MRKSKLKEVYKKALTYLSEYQTAGDTVPTIAGLAIYCDCHRSTLYEYASNNQEFSKLLDKVKAVQEKELINKGLNGSFNASIVKLMLFNHGYSEKQEITANAWPENNITNNQPTIIQLVAAVKGEDEGDEYNEY